MSDSLTGLLGADLPMNGSNHVSNDDPEDMEMQPPLRKRDKKASASNAGDKYLDNGKPADELVHTAKKSITAESNTIPAATASISDPMTVNPAAQRISRIGNRKAVDSLAMLGAPNN